MHILFSLWHSIQQRWFPHLEKELDPLTEKEFVRVVELAAIEILEIDLRSFWNPPNNGVALS